MNDRERRRWAGLCVTLTGLTLATAAILKNDRESSESGIKSAIEAMKIWTRELEEDVAAPPTVHDPNTCPACIALRADDKAAGNLCSVCAGVGRYRLPCPECGKTYTPPEKAQ